jgi:hypothetical protein
MTKRNMLMSALTAVTVTAMAATGALANENTPTSESMTAPTIGPAHDQLTASLYIHNMIEVEADNLDWAHAKPTTLGLPLHVEAKTTKNKWRITGSDIVVGLAPITSAGVVGSCCGQLGEYSEYNYASQVDHSPNTHHVNQDAWWTLKVTDKHMGTLARNACRKMRGELEDQGMSQDEIFGEDRHTLIPVDFRYVAAVSYVDVNPFGTVETFWMQSQPTWANIDVLCKKRIYQVNLNPNVKPGPDNVVAAFQVNQAALAITPKHYEAKCPAKLHLNPTIEATGKGTVKYRFVDQLGNKSQTFQVKFDKHDVKFLDHVIELDGKGKPKGLGFATPQAQGGGLGYAAPNDPNLLQGYFQVEVTSPHHKLSNFADYSVKCTVKTAGDGEIAAVPDNVNPVVVGGLAAGLPDLFIDSVQASPAVPTKLFVKITNKGIGASTPTNLKAIRWTGSQSTARGTLVPAIAAGQSQVVQAELGGTIAGATQLYVRVDDPNRIHEQDEMNNSFKVK